MATSLQLCSAHYTALQTKNSRRSDCNNPVTEKNMTIHTPSTINYCLESAAAITLHFQLCSAPYTALQTKNSVRIISAINPVTTENTDDSRLQTYCREAMHHATANRHLGLSQKEMGHKSKSMMRALYVLRYAKRHVSGQSNVKQ